MPDTISVQVLLFAHLRRQRDPAEWRQRLPAGATVRDLAAYLQQEGLDLSGCMAAVNEDYAAPDTVLHGGDEVAFLPPVAGGSDADRSSAEEGLVFVTVTPEPLSLEAAAAFLVRPRYGAQSYFVGTVRSPNRGETVALIEYEAYAGMAEKLLRAAVAEAQAKFGSESGDLAVYVAHRTGKLAAAEASIVIGVGSPHRRAALEATDWLIERIKATVPVWKLEVLESGERWVEGAQPAPTL